RRGAGAAGGPRAHGPRARRRADAGYRWPGARRGGAGVRRAPRHARGGPAAGPAAGHDAMTCRAWPTALPGADVDGVRMVCLADAPGEASMRRPRVPPLHLLLALALDRQS